MLSIDGFKYFSYVISYNFFFFFGISFSFVKFDVFSISGFIIFVVVVVVVCIKSSSVTSFNLSLTNSLFFLQQQQIDFNILI